jgi:hypothetical protein
MADCVLAALEVMRQDNVTLAANVYTNNWGTSLGTVGATGFAQYMENNATPDLQALFNLRATYIGEGPTMLSHLWGAEDMMPDLPAQKFYDGWNPRLPFYISCAPDDEFINYDELKNYYTKLQTMPDGSVNNNVQWLDFNMFQSGHRRYGQRRGDGDTSNTAETEEDNWRYVEAAHLLQPLKPILDAEPSYERIPQGLHDTTQPKWQAQDCRRYAWWSVLAGSCGHTYGNNALMQFYQPGDGQAYGCTTPWYEAVYDPGFLQMQYVKRLMLMLPYFDRVADQSVLVGEYGKRYERPVASRGKDYIVAYTYVGGALDVDLSRISGSQKKAWWYSPSTGEFRFIGEFADSKCQHFAPDAPYGPGYDQVLVIVDASKDYIRTL